MRSLPWLLALLVLLVPLALSRSVHAQDAPSVRLDFASEGEGCPNAGAFTDEVSARIGRVGFDDSSEQVAVVRIARTANEALVSAEFGGNTRVFRDADCRVAAEAAAAAIAVWLDESSERVPVYGVAIGTVAHVEEEAPDNAGIVADGRVLLRVTTNLTTRDPEEDFSFHIETNTGRGGGGAAHFFDRLCLMPCETRVTTGVHQFGLSQGIAPAHALSELTQIEGDSELHIEVTLPDGVVRAGAALYLAGFLGLLAAAPVWIVGAVSDRPRLRRGGMWSTIAASALFVGGILMIKFGDKGGTEITVRPF